MMNMTTSRAAAASQQSRRSGFLGAAMIIVALSLASAAEASTYRWQANADGDWNASGNWEVVEGPAGAGYPNLAGDIAVFEPPTAARTITIPDGVTITIGRLTASLSTPSGTLTIAAAGTGLLVFDNVDADAVIESSGTGEPVVLSTPIQLATDVVINGRFQSIRGISESGGARNVTITGGSVTYGSFPATPVANTYTGTTTVANGSLSAQGTDALIPLLGALIVGDGDGAAASASVSITGRAIDPSAHVLVRADGSITARIDNSLTYSPTFGSLTVLGGRVVVSSFPTEVTVRGPLTMEGGEIELQGLLWLAGSVNATSTAAGPAAIRANILSPGGVTLAPGNRDFTIADGPQPIDLVIDAAVTNSVYTGPSSLTKLGAGVMQMTRGAGYRDATLVAAGELIVAGSVHPLSSAFTVGADAMLSGTAALQAGVTVAAGGALSPGRTGVVGTMASGPLVFATGAHFLIDIASSASFDLVNVTGAVTLGNATLDVTAALSLLPVTFTLISNDGSDPVIGTFLGLAEGAQIATANGAVFTISYRGGDGNDVVLYPASVTYFLSEGATGTFFDEDVLIANPNTVPAPVTMTFFKSGYGGTVVRQMTIPAQSRATIAVDEIDGLDETSVSVEVRSDNRLPLAVERTMFWDRSHYGGHTANAVPAARTQWFFAEGAQGFFDTYLLLANPNPEPTEATVTFLRENEPPFVITAGLYGQSRRTIHAGEFSELAGRSFGITVDTPAPITAERAMYFATTPQRLWSGGTDNVGSAEAATSWFHPEGASGTFFSTFILMSNPQTSPATVRLRFLLPSGAPIEITRTIGAQQRLTINPATEGIAALQNASFSTVVTSDVPIVSERSMYWNADGTALGEGHASSGLTTVAPRWLLAEGRVGGPNAYTTYILLANPGSSAASVTVTFLRESATPIVEHYVVPANSRFNIDVGTMVPALQNESFGTLIQVTDGDAIAVERSMYWNVDGRFWSGGTNAVGSVVPE